MIRPQEIFDSLASVPIIQVVAVICFILTLFLQRPLRWGAQQGMLLLLLLVIVLSGVFNGWGRQGVLDAQSMIVSSNIPLFLYATLISTASRQRKIMLITLLASVLMVHNGHLQATQGIGWTGTEAIVVKYTEEIRIQYLGFFSDPNDLGMLLVMNLPFLAYFYSRGKFFSKVICLSIMVFFLYGIVLTGSRGTVLGACSLVAFYLLFKHGGARLIAFALLLGPVVITLLSSFGGLSSSESSSRSRLEAWYDGIHYLFWNPLLGIGKGNFFDYHGLTAHNSYVLVSSELGGLGFTLWGGALVFTVWLGFRIFKLPDAEKKIAENKNNLSDELKLNTALFFSLLGFMVTAFFLSRAYTLLLYVFMGVTIASHYRVAFLVPSIRKLMTLKNVIMCSFASWLMIVMVYLALKVAL
ncbi:O-antigen ligase family protein [Alteromonas flava]|uniref:O-antigen ligase family protein n=1 Tax=Alteromonas flava TaxID=2048003 RepID=UPI000C2835AD|nr:O-antigen ligase family protein [Alteromonas flava]